MALSRNRKNDLVSIGNKDLQLVLTFKYLGSTTSEFGNIEEEMNQKVDSYGASAENS